MVAHLWRGAAQDSVEIQQQSYLNTISRNFAPADNLTHARVKKGKFKVSQMETLQEQKAPATAAQTGIVKWFNPGKGYGFIAPDAGGDDIFVHISAVQHAGLRKLNEGERVKFAIEQRQGRLAAVGLERAN